MAITNMAKLRDVYPPPAARAGLSAAVNVQVVQLKPLAIKGTLPLSVLKVTVEEAFLHCAKALIRARLWEPDARVERSRYPTYGQVLADQITGAEAAAIDAGEAESARTELF